MQRYEQIKCRVCGDRLEKQVSGIYKCDYCGAEYERTDIEQYIKAIRQSMREEVNDAIAEQRNRDIGAARQNLYAEIKAEHINSYNVIGCCRKLKEYLPDDFQANTFEVLNSGSKKQINKCLDSIDEKGEGRYYIKDILDFMLRSLVTANVLSLKSLADRALNGEEKTRYLNAIEEEAEKYNEGMYNPKIPRKAFIAYSSNDMQRVNEIVNYLEDSGISCFVALRNLRHGRGSVENYGKILEEAMHNCKCFVLISSRNSRRLDCDAMDKELPYVRDHEPQVKRIEYIIDDYGNEGGAKAILKDFFGPSEQCRHPNLDDLVTRISNAKSQKQEADSNGDLQKQLEEYKKQLADELKRRRKQLEEEYKRKEEELKKREEKVSRKHEAKDIEENCLALANIDNTKFKIVRTILVKYIGGDNKVKIPQGITIIGPWAFRGCSSLVSIEIPNSVTTIGGQAFEGCSSLVSIEIPNSITTIGPWAFGGCSSLVSIEIPNSVTTINSYAFKGCNGLKSIEIPNSVTTINSHAFDGCSSLKSIEIPNSVTEIGGGLFSGCDNLESIVVSEENVVYHSNGDCLIETATNELVCGCNNSVIPNYVTSIGYDAFSGCSGLQSIEIPNSVTKIDAGAFENCSNLLRLIIPNSVTEIVDGPFNGCDNLESIVVSEENVVYHSNGNCLIETATNELVCGCNNSVIPNYVTSIGYYAFSGRSSLQSIEIPNSVTTIGAGAFENCSNLLKLIIPNSIITIDGPAFDGCENLTIYYKGNSRPDGWDREWDSDCKVIWGYKG